ncbi:MAG: hypothetical protein Q8903_07690, partial [Bacteroidota bacterium]|nr:hypothetical protein [Bacteroidota bacterium]
MRRIYTFLIITFITVQFSFAQAVPDDTILNTIKNIKTEAVKNPQTINYVTYLSDVVGSRVTWSPGFNKSVDWAVGKLSEMGLSNSHTEEWEPLG